MRPLWSKLYDRVSTAGRVALVTLIGAEGSTPRETGARMIVTRDGDILGTIGGGTLEYRVIEEARKALRDEGWRAVAQDVPLGPDLGQCCGGRITYLVETFDQADLDHIRGLVSFEMQGDFSSVGEMAQASHLQRRATDAILLNDLVVTDRTLIRESFKDDRVPILLFGAGHVGRALTLALAPLPFRIRWIDSRDDAFPSLIPHNANAVRAADIEAEIRSAPPHAFVLVMTHSHPLDLAIVASALMRNDLPFVGLIGSDTKRARFVRRLREMGLGEAADARLVSPIGLAAILGKEPAVIAASIVTDLLIRRDALMKEKSSAYTAYHIDDLNIGTHPHE